MHVVILGSGVIGVSSAWYLARAGHQVTVVDRQPEAGMETSFANAGQISPGYSAPWAAPGVPLKAIKWLMQDLAPLRFKPQLNLHQWQWLWQMLMNCNHRAYERNKARMLRIAEYSRDSLRELRRETGITYDNRAQGLIQLFRTDKQVAASAVDQAILDECQVQYQVLSVDDCIHYEPALKHVAHKLKGGLRLPGDETGNCFLFTQRLAQLCRDEGVSFRFQTEVEALEFKGSEIVGLRSGEDLIQGDVYLIAAGSYSRELVKPLGLDLPIYPVKGYSLTLPIEDESRAPQSTVMDETYKIAISRLGSRIRVGGTAELSGYNLDLPEYGRKNLEFVVNDLFGGAANASTNLWTGMRPMTPDGTPILGATSYDNLFLNTGHGTLGWTMAVGSARYLSDLISGKRPEIDSEGLSMYRYLKAGKEPLRLGSLADPV